MDPATSRTAEALEQAFDRATAFTIGLEEELLIVDRSGAPTPRAPELLRALADSRRFHAELSPAQIEIVSGVHHDTAGAVADLVQGRRLARDAANGELRLVGMPVHPTSERLPWISPGDRYASIDRRFGAGARRAGLAGGLHVHLGVPGAARLLAVYNALRGYMPEIAALAAAAPFFGGRDSGLASVRPLLADALPRQGVPPRFRTWAAYARLLEWGSATGAFRGHRELWWGCRLHPGFGTIEVRVADVQAAVEDVHAVASLVHALAHWLATRHDAGERLPAHDTVAIAENRWRAAWAGSRGDLVDLDRHRLVNARARLEGLIDAVSGYADGRADGLERAAHLLDHPHPRAQRLRARLGLPALIEHLADVTERTCAGRPDMHVRAARGSR